MNFGKPKQRNEPEINLIAFIDILLVIVIFLMATTTYSQLTQLHVTLPTSSANKMVAPPSEINVAINAQGEYAVNNVLVPGKDIHQLVGALHSAQSSLPELSSAPVVIINADQMATHQSVIQTLEAARLAGLEKITFAMQQSG